MRIDYKPLSANDMWKGQRFVSPEYKRFKRDVGFMLPAYKMPEKPYSITLTFGFSNPASDVDNPVKSIVDVLQKKYKFNDKDVYQLHVYKQVVPVGKEFINFSIEHCVI